MASQHPPSALQSSSSPAPGQPSAPSAPQEARDCHENQAPKAQPVREMPPAPAVFSDWAAI